MTKDISGMRENYKWGYLLEKDADPDPVIQFRKWMDEALASKLLEPNAMNLATVSATGHPSSRIVLLKGFSEDGLVFYTNYESKKAQDMASNPHVALNFLWKEIERQVRIEGKVSKISRKDSEAYFHSRPIGSQLGALSSHQSCQIKDRDTLEERYEEFAEKYQAETKVPLPEHWGGYLVQPAYFEFWQGRESRLHDRLEYRKQFDNGTWEISRLEP